MTSNECGLSRWRIDGHPFVLECTDEVIEDLKRCTLTADLFPPERGTLWGIRDGNTVRVSSVARSAPSDSGEKRIAVGWFQIRIETDIHLTSDDLLYHNERFSEPGSTVLILRPATSGGVRVGVFFRELNGAMRSASSYQEVILRSLDPDFSPAQATDRAPVRRSFTRGPENRAARVWIAFLAGIVAGALAFAGMRREPASVPSAFSTRVLAEQTRQLQNELEAEKLHNRRLEAALAILRDRSKIKSTPIAQSFDTTSKMNPGTPPF